MKNSKFTLTNLVHALDHVESYFDDLIVSTKNWNFFVGSAGAFGSSSNEMLMCLYREPKEDLSRQTSHNKEEGTIVFGT